MKINEKLYNKYGANAVILPPPPEDVTDVEIRPEPATARRSIIDMGLEWVPDFQGTESDLSEEEILDRLSKRKTSDNPLDLLNKPSEDSGFNTSTEESSTIPPARRAHITPDTLVKLCSKYYDLCHKL